MIENYWLTRIELDCVWDYDEIPGTMRDKADSLLEIINKIISKTKPDRIAASDDIISFMRFNFGLPWIYNHGYQEIIFYRTKLVIADVKLKNAWKL